MSHIYTTPNTFRPANRCCADAYVRTLVSVVACLLLCSCQMSVQADTGSKTQTPFFESANLDPGIPTPASVVGYSVTEKAVRYPALVRYLQKLAEVSERVTLTSYGQTHEGRTLYYLTITSKGNHKRLDKIKADNAKLADPRKLRNTNQAKRLLEEMPAVAWLCYNIHGDELSSADAAMYIAYRLAAGKDESILKLLEEVVIHIDPLMNPDGRERFLSHLEQLTGVVSSPDYQAMQHMGLWSRGRGNHYLFDLNRDWIVHAHPEIRNRIEVIRSWNPHLLVDSHEMGPYDTYLFDPPREPINIYLSKNNMSWRQRFSLDQAAAFDRQGWSYYTKGWYSDWGPMYTNAWANLLGATGILYEQARANAATIKQPTGYETKYSETVHHHIVSSLTNLQTLRTNRREFLSDFLADKQWAVSGQGPHTETFLLPPAKDRSRWNSLVELVKRHGIEIKFARHSFEAKNLTDIWGNKADSQTLSKGTLIALSAQPNRRMLHALLAFDPHFTDSFLAEERKDLENHRGSRIYDVTSWNLSMNFALDAYWAETISDVKTSSEPAHFNSDSARLVEKSDYGYLIDFNNSDIYPALVRLFDNNCNPRIGTKPFQIGDKSYPPGSVLLRIHENPDNLFEILQQIDADFDVDIRIAETGLVQEGPDLGDRKLRLLTAPRVAITSQWPVSSRLFGSVWYLLDHHIRLQTSPINIQNINRVDLRKYNCLILPSAGRVSSVLDEKTIKKLRGWVEDGGTLIAIGDSAAFVAGKDRGLSSVRLKRDVLDELCVYEEAIQREKNARNIKIDPAEIWGSKPAEDSQQKVEENKAEKPKKSDSKDDVEKLKRTDKWQRIFSPRGTFVTGIVDTEHWLGFGLEDKMPLLFFGDYAFMSRHPVATPVRLADEEHLRLSGLLWPEARQRLADTAYVTVESVGNGQIILFAGDPTFRDWLPGSKRFLLNAILLGPGMGTSVPLPW
ncbi:MAG: M14 family metallopeptidase [Planctomycetota bacterium]